MTANPFEKLLIEKFFAGDTKRLQTPAGQADLRVHLHERTDKYRPLYGDWLERTIPRGGRVLEIGIGTGSASVVLAERGLSVDGLEIDPDHADIAVARMRQHRFAYGQVIIGNVAEALPGRDLSVYDAVIFWATLEHMTIAERLTALAAIWAAMKPGAHLIVTECPNRLWFYDSHTAQLPFYHWLPDDLAKQVGKHADLDPVAFARTGRGASHHEFQLSGIPVSPETRIDSLQLFKRRHHALKRLKWMLNADGRFERKLFKLARSVHRAFFHEYIDVAITKP